MNILLVNKYLYPRGGSETVFFNQAALMEQKGHAVSVMAMEHPRNLVPRWPAAFVSRVATEGRPSPAQALRAAGRMLYSFQARRRLEALLRRFRPNAAHLHNIHHQISPSILHTLRLRGVPAVMSLHDLKLACPVYTCLSRGRVCERCRGGRFYWCVLRKCSQGSAAKSVLAALEMTLHRFVFRFEKKVDIFLAPSLFLKKKLEEMGVRAPIVHLPHFLDAEAFTPEFRGPDRPAYIFFGRLDRVKGLATLARAASGLPWTCTIVGDGELRPELEKASRAAEPGRLRIRPHLGREALQEEVRRSTFAVLPSEWYENAPLMVLEAFALGKPVVGARIGGVPELVRDGETGLLFEPGDPDDLREKIKALASDPRRAEDMGRRARRFVAESLNPEGHYHRLMDIYRSLGS
ncbi:MAG: glycosyltransferase family 4 protein [Candidatus Aminicenantes bacterium]|nr:glycosyltransferase family 4 protein [Candidatus Aminicenantes bacterium]